MSTSLHPRLREVVSDVFLKFASTAPSIVLSPESKRQSYLGKVQELPSPSPASKARKLVLQEPTKKGLADYDKTLASHEAALKRGVQDLDKATQDYRESAEMRDAEQKKLAEKLAQKRKRAESALENARRIANRGKQQHWIQQKTLHINIIYNSKWYLKLGLLHNLIIYISYICSISCQTNQSQNEQSQHHHVLFEDLTGSKPVHLINAGLCCTPLSLQERAPCSRWRAVIWFWRQCQPLVWV